MEDTELGGRPGLVGAAQDTDAARSATVAVEMLVSPDLRALVKPRTDAVSVVPVGQEDRGHLDLAVQRFLEHGAHLLGGRCVVPGLDDDPTLGRFERKTIADAPTAHRVDAAGHLLDALGVADAPLGVGEQRGARRHGTVGSGRGFAAQGWTLPGVVALDRRGILGLSRSNRLFGHHNPCREGWYCLHELSSGLHGIQSFLDLWFYFTGSRFGIPVTSYSISLMLSIFHERSKKALVGEYQRK